MPGLLRGLDTKDAPLELEAVAALGAAGDPRAAPALCERLDADAAEAARRDAAQAALRKIGRPSIPALIESLRRKKTRRYAATMLYELSGGQTFGEDPRAWAEWWRKQ